MKWLKLFWKTSPKYTIVKSLGKFYIRRKCSFGYEYLTCNAREEYWWSENYKQHAAFDTYEEALARWGSSDISDGGTDEIVKIVKILK